MPRLDPQTMSAEEVLRACQVALPQCSAEHRALCVRVLGEVRALDAVQDFASVETQAARAKDVSDAVLALNASAALPDEVQP